MSKVWVCVAIPESREHYVYVYNDKPTKEQLWERVWNDEGQIEDLEFYEGTCDFIIRQCDIDEVQ